MSIERILIVGSLGSLAYVGILFLIWRETMMLLLGHVRGAMGLRSDAT